MNIRRGVLENPPMPPCVSNLVGCVPLSRRWDYIVVCVVGGILHTVFVIQMTFNLGLYVFEFFNGDNIVISALLVLTLTLPCFEYIFLPLEKANYFTFILCFGDATIFRYNRYNLNPIYLSQPQYVVVSVKEATNCKQWLQ